MVGTRNSASDTKKRSTRRADTTLPPGCGDGSPPAADGLAGTVALVVNGDWTTCPPSIGQIEAALTGNGRTQHRIWRIDMGSDSAVVHVHPNDVAGCIGIVGTGNLQLKVSVMGAQPATAPLAVASPTVATAAVASPAVAVAPPPAVAPPVVVAPPAIALSAPFAPPAPVLTSSPSLGGGAPMVVQAVASPVAHAVAPPKKRPKTDGASPTVVAAASPQLPTPPQQLGEAISEQLGYGGAASSKHDQQVVPQMVVLAAPEAGASAPEGTLVAMRAPAQLAISAPSDAPPLVAPKVDGAPMAVGVLPAGVQISPGGLMAPPGAVCLTAAQLSAQRKADDDKQRRLYRVGLSYRCGRCGKPKKGHVCDMPDPDAEGGGVEQPAPAPAILATTVRKGTPPALLGSPLAVASSPMAVVSPRNAQAVAKTVKTASPLADVKIAGEATTIFKDMVAALGESSGATPPPSGLGSPTNGADAPAAMPPSSISPLAASAIAAGSVASAAAAAPSLAASAAGPEPQLSEMDLMLADLAFAARPPPVITPDEGGHEAGGEPVGNGLGSLSPSNFSPGTMIQQLITTPSASAGWSASQMAEMQGMTACRAGAVVAQPSA